MEPVLRSAHDRLSAERERVDTLVQELRSRVDPGHHDEASERGEQKPGAATETVERQTYQAILERLEAELAEIDAALDRVADGTYGRDEVTGAPIDPARLDALPTARTNVGTARDLQRDGPLPAPSPTASVR
jgi:DnaK suppressor protein